MNIEEFGVFLKDTWRWSVSEASYLFIYLFLYNNDESNEVR